MASWSTTKRKLAMNIFSSPSGTQMYDEQSFYRAFQKDLYSARRNVIIESPFITLRRIEELLPVIIKLRRKRSISNCKYKKPD